MLPDITKTKKSSKKFLREFILNLRNWTKEMTTYNHHLMERIHFLDATVVVNYTKIRNVTLWGKKRIGNGTMIMFTQRGIKLYSGIGSSENIQLVHTSGVVVFF